jgi:hypothetical protein
MITSDGWLDWAVRLPAAAPRINSGGNSAKGLFMHSAEGYASVLLDPNSQWGYNGNHSWHLSNLFDGTVYQHYSFTARCHHATAANQAYIGVENEGTYQKEPTLTNAQVASAQRFINEIAVWKDWTPSRPNGPTDISHTLWEHNEVVRLGGIATACPSGRIPWDLILNTRGDDMIRLNGVAPYWNNRQLPTGPATMQVHTDFPQLPAEAKRIRLEMFLSSGRVVVLDGRTGAYAGQVGWGGSNHKEIDIEIGPGREVTLNAQEPTTVALIGILGYWT